jgi:alpha-D-ribose 1-methylphosphonate 5-triphosphate synthase subunit PhnG
MPTFTDFKEQSTYLSVLAAAPAEQVKLFVDDLLAHLPPVQVLQNRTGLAMLPYADGVKGAAFHLGEVLLAEAHVQVAEQEGYGACLGNDLVQALALAILDAVLQSHAASLTALHAPVIDFVTTLATEQTLADDALLRKVEATRVELETF